MSIEMQGWCLALLFMISFVLGVFLRNYLSKRFNNIVITNKKKIKLLGYLKNAMYRYPNGGLCNASDMLFGVQIINRTEKDILHDIIAEFKPDKTWSAHYYFEPGDYISRVY